MPIYKAPPVNKVNLKLCLSLIESNPHFLVHDTNKESHNRAEWQEKWSENIRLVIRGVRLCVQDLNVDVRIACIDFLRRELLAVTRGAFIMSTIERINDTIQEEQIVNSEGKMDKPIQEQIISELKLPEELSPYDTQENIRRIKS